MPRNLKSRQGSSEELHNTLSKKCEGGGNQFIPESSTEEAMSLKASVGNLLIQHHASKKGGKEALTLSLHRVTQKAKNIKVSRVAWYL